MLGQCCKKNEMSTIAEHEMPENLAMKIQNLQRQELSAPLRMKHAALTADTWQHCNDLLGVLCTKAMFLLRNSFWSPKKLHCVTWRQSSDTIMMKMMGIPAIETFDLQQAQLFSVFCHIPSVKQFSLRTQQFTESSTSQAHLAWNGESRQVTLVDRWFW